MDTSYLEKLLISLRDVTPEELDGHDFLMHKQISHAKWMALQILSGDVREQDRERWYGMVYGIMWSYGFDYKSLPPVASPEQECVDAEKELMRRL